MKSVEAAENKVVLSTTDEEKDEEVNYDILLICTGGSYCAPIRSADEKVVTLEQRKEEMTEVQNAIKEASSVLCVGAGATGIETACYLKEFYPHKTVGITLRGNTLLKRIPGAHPLVEAALKEAGVEIHYNKDVTEAGASIPLADGSGDYAYVIDCKGFRTSGPATYLHGDMAGCIDKSNGRIMVNDHFQVTNVHPIASVN